MYRFFFIVFFAACMLIAASCKDKKQELDYGYTYYPLTVGEYRIYDVDKTTYSTFDTVREQYQLKEFVAEIYTINGETRYRLERYKRVLPNDPWPATPDSVWAAFVTSSRAVKIENNIRFVKLVFPVENGKVWNGNAENNRGEEKYTLLKAGSGYTVNSQYYPETAKVLHRFDTSFVSRDYREEVYAKKVGMVYKINEQYKYSQAPGDWMRHVIQSGIKYEEKLSSYGQQ